MAKKKSSEQMAELASKALKNKNTSKTTKSLAGSVLSQYEKDKKKKK